MGRLDNYNVYLHTYTLRYKQTQEKNSTLRCTSLRGVEFFPIGKEERGGAAQGGFLLFILFIHQPDGRSLYSRMWNKISISYFYQMSFASISGSVTKTNFSLYNSGRTSFQYLESKHYIVNRWFYRFLNLTQNLKNPNIKSEIESNFDRSVSPTAMMLHSSL